MNPYRRACHWILTRTSQIRASRSGATTATILLGVCTTMADEGGESEDLSGEVRTEIAIETPGVSVTIKAVGDTAALIDQARTLWNDIHGVHNKERPGPGFHLEVERRPSFDEE